MINMDLKYLTYRSLYATKYFCGCQGNLDNAPILSYYFLEINFKTLLVKMDSLT